MINIEDLLETRSKVWQSGISTVFERKFLINITRDCNLCDESSIFSGGILDKSNTKKKIHISKKQEKIYLDIQLKYNNKSIKGDLFDKYMKLFKEKNITLDSFDLKHLETFKGVFNESINFRKWLFQIDSSFKNEYQQLNK